MTTHPKRESDPHALPDVEVFALDGSINDDVHDEGRHERAGREMLAIFKCRFVACPTCGYDTPVEDNGLIALHGDRHGDCAGAGRPCAS